MVARRGLSAVGPPGGMSHVGDGQVLPAGRPRSYNADVMSQAPSSTGPPPRPALLPALSAAAAVALAGFGVLAMLPPQLAFETRVAFGDASYCIPVDVLALAQHDFAFGNSQNVLLGRIADGELKAAWQTNYFSQPATPSGAVDVDGDGTEELCLYAGDSLAAHAWALGADGREVVRLDPLRERSERPDVPWDGRICIDDATLRSSRHVLVCRLVSGFSRRPRGVTLVDALTRERQWTYDLGTAPMQASADDIDGDGAEEVLVTTASPDNGVARNGTDDSHCYVIALGADGARRWQVEVGGPFGISYATVIPRSHGAPRVVGTYCSRRSRLPEPGRLFLIDGASGSVLERHEFNEGLGVPHAFESGGGFVVGGDEGIVRRFDADARLVRAQPIGTMCEVWGIADLDGDGQDEIVASTPDAVIVLGRDLAVRARLGVRRLEAPVTVRLATAGVGRSRLAVLDGRALVVDVLPRPSTSDPGRMAGVFGASLAAGAAVPLLRRFRRRRMPTGAAAREFLLDYHQIRHETFELERPFAHVRLWAQAHAAGHALPVESLERACQEFAQIGLPSVLRYAERAAAVGVERARVRDIRTNARRTADRLALACRVSGEERVACVREALGTIDALAQDCYEAYWEVVMRAPCRVHTVAAQAMMGKTLLLEQAHITTRYEADPGAREPVLFDPDELRTLLGELVENAVRALDRVPEAVLSVSIKEHPTDPRRIVVKVRDNGTGIPPGMRDSLFEADTSTREGGGFGLFHAREVARRWMAELTLEDPPDGRGSEIRLVLRACRVVDRPARAVAPPGGAS